MAKLLFEQLEAFRKQKGLSILALCRQMGVYNHTYHRWKKSGNITEAYQRIISNFLTGSKTSPYSIKNKEAPNNADIAVIGIACYYPGASNPQELWENILARRVQFRRMLDGRLPLGEYYDEDPKTPEKTYLTKAAFLENFNFDWGRLRIPRKTVESTDIVHWLALDTALKTFEEAGYKLSEIPLQNTGVIVGNTLTGEQTRSQSLRLRWPFVQKALNATLGHLGKSIEERSQIASEMEKIYKSAFYPVTEDSLAGGLANTIAGRICNYLNLKGGGYIVDGACSSSLLAVATAADALKMGNMDLVLAGGVDISLDPFELVGFAKAGALARYQMRVYDQKANGFLPGEGCGFVLLKRLKDAIRDKNYVYAVIKGWGISSDGKGGIMEPSSSGQSFAIGRAYKDLEYKISDVDFVEGHGTGTTKGDRVELEGIATAIEKTVKKGDENKRGCGITSFKSIVGHTKAAAGVGGLIKAVLAVNQRILPPTANCTHPNDVFQDKAKNLYPIVNGGRLPQDNIARAGISSAGFGGINCHITVESRDKPKEGLKSKIDERALFVSHQETEVFVFTSRTMIHLKKIIGKFKEDLRNISLAEMADLAALLNKKVKNRLPIKVAIVTDTPEHLYEALILLENEIGLFQVEEGLIHRIKAKDAATHIVISNGIKKNRIGFLYPGQGSQRLHMTRTLVHRYSWARDLFRLTSLPLFETVYASSYRFLTKEQQQDFEKQLSDTKITQPAVVLSSLIWTEFLSKLGIEPQVCKGHSLGELMVFYKAGEFNKETLIKFAQLRGELMASPARLAGSMVSLMCSRDKAEALVEKIPGNIVIANINSPNQIVVSGGKKEIEKIKELAKKENITAYPLNVSNAFHSSLMKEASDKIKKTRILPDKLREYFSKQVISPVDFVGAVDSASKECDLMLEVGPGRVLTDLVKAINKDILCLPVESTSGNDRDLNIVLAEIFVRNVPVKFEELYRNRLIKTFVPASRKKFIENQCERPLRIDKQLLTNKFLPVLLQIKEKEEPIEEIIPGGLPEVKGKDYIADLLINLTHKITGFDLESISLKLMLLDDLNLDSIKAAELIGQAARTLGIAGQVDPSQLSNKSLEEICDRLYVLSAQTRAGAIKESVSDILKRYQDKMWVRNFTSELKPEEIKTKNVNQLKGLKNVVFLSGKHEESLVKKLEGEFKIIKAKTQKIDFGASKGKAEKSSRIDCLIAILPKNILPRHPEPPTKTFGGKLREGSRDFDKNSLKSIMEHLHQITGLANSSRIDKDSFVVFVQFGGGARSLASTLFLERPDLKVRVIDFDGQSDEHKISQKIIDELQTYESFSAVEYDNKLVRHAVYYENSNPSNYKKRDISWSGKDVVLVTGGAKGITAQCALEFARTTNARMVLVGRSPMPENKKDETNEITRTLKQFENEKLKCSYYQCDVSNEKDVAGVIAEIEKKAGKITGFIHGAGLNSLKRLKQANVQEAFKEVLPKVMGAVNICNALKDHPPKLIVGITSIIGLTGMEASGWYGFSNEILNLYLQQFNPRVVTIAYSIWDEVGMGAKLGSVHRLAEKGIGAIPVVEGVRHFKQLIEGDPGVQQVIVAARIAGIATWKSPELKTNSFRFLEKIEYVLPGIELIARADLSVEDDPYLLDHNWKGSLLFPFVFGFEAMAQAVACVLGVEKFDHIKAKDINLQRPIPVPQDVGTTIEIHAQVLEQEDNKHHSRERRIDRHSQLFGGNPIQVKVEIYSQETAYKEPHFSAIFEISAVIARSAVQRSEPTKQSLSTIQQRAKNVIDIDMQTDIYGPILFQGKMFQCIEQIHELYYDEKTKKGECVFTSAYNKSAEEFLKKNKKFNKRFLIGDPFFIDSLLQSMQLIIPQDLSLPRKIEEINLHLVNLKNKEFCYAKSHIHKISNEQGIGNTRAHDGDHKILEVKNCDLKILQTILDRPSANDLVDPTQRDKKIIEERINKLSKELGLIPPLVECLHCLGLKGSHKEERHKIELPYIRLLIKKLLKKENRRVNFSIKWDKFGRPLIVGKELKDINVSLSHDSDFLLMVAGYGIQGCDVETIRKRNENDWLSLLGNERFECLRKQIKANFDIHLMGTIIWTVEEVSKKLNKHIKFQTLSFNKFGEDNFIIEIDRQIKFLAACLKLTKGEKRIITLSFENIVESQIVSQDSEILLRMNYDKDAFGIKVRPGPKGQPTYIQRLPMTFQHNQHLSRRVFFTNFFSWIGSLREYGMFPVRNEFTRMVETGQWGLATNSIKLRIFDELRGDDVVEVRMYMDGVVGGRDSIFDFIFDWQKMVSNNKFERIALAQLRSSWLKITGHGEGEIDKLPNYLKVFMDTMKPSDNNSSFEQTVLSVDKKFQLGKEIASFSNLNNRYFLDEGRFQTTLEDSNLVGNVYFANYAKWLGRIRDFFFYKINHAYYLSGKRGEFFCISCDIDHLREAMPFDEILVKMFLNKIYENGLSLYFEFFLVKSGKIEKKLASANHSTIWLRWDNLIEPEVSNLPKDILDYLLHNKSEIRKKV